MARLPQAQDMGARPGLYVGGAGPRDQSGDILDQGVQHLANTAFQVAEGMKKREDAFAYSSAKSEFLLADIEARRSLVGDPDWKTHEKKYQERMKAAGEKIAATITSPNDRRLFEMDTKVGLAQGALAVSQGARKMEVDQGRANVQSIGANFRTAFVDPAATEEDRTNLLKQYNEHLGNAYAKGYITDVELKTLGKEMTVDFVTGALAAMPAEDRLALLTAPSKGNRTMATKDPKGLVEGGNINIDDRPHVQNADGSGSSVLSASFNYDGVEVLLPKVSEDGKIMSNEEAKAQYEKTGRHLGKFDSVEAANAYANDLHLQQERDYGKQGNMTDFLDADVKQKLIDGSRAELSEDTVRKASQDFSDTLLAKYKDPSQIGDAMKEAKDMNNYKHLPEAEARKARDATVIRVEAAYADIAAVEKAERDQILEEGRQRIADGFIADAIASDDWVKLTKQEQEAVIAYSDYERKGVEPPHNFVKYNDWQELSVREKADANIKLLYRPHVDDYSWGVIEKEQKLAQATIEGSAEAAKQLAGTDATNEAIANALVISGIFPNGKPGAKASPKARQRWAMIDNAINKRILAEGANNPVDRQNIIDSVVLDVVWKDTSWFGANAGPEMIAAGVLPDEIEDTFVKYETIPADEILDLERLAASEGLPKPDRDQIEKAYAAVRFNDLALVLKHLGSE